MKWSAAEIYALAVKAARGAGAPAGQAERFGQAATMHLMAGRAETELFSTLDAAPGGPILTYPLALDCALASVAEGGIGVLENQPVNDLLLSYAETLPFCASIEGNGSEVHLKVDLSTPRRRKSLKRVDISEELIRVLSSLAEKTLVPESESSRLSGAGAGLTDND